MKTKMKIAILVLHIMCVIAFGLCAIVATNTLATILYTVCAALWCVNVGIDIATLVHNN